MSAIVTLPRCANPRCRRILRHYESDGYPGQPCCGMRCAAELPYNDNGIYLHPRELVAQ